MPTEIAADIRTCASRNVHVKSEESGGFEPFGRDTDSKSFYLSAFSTCIGVGILSEQQSDIFTAVEMATHDALAKLEHRLRKNAVTLR